MENFSTIILAAGKGTRMKSDLPKVLHEINGKPLVQYVVESANMAGSSKNYIIVGYKKELVIEKISDSNSKFVVQEEQFGTGHAVMMAEEQLKNYDGAVIILSGDVPMITSKTVKNIVAFYYKSGYDAVVATVELENPGTYGRVLKNSDGSFVAIREARDATERELQVKEINTGIYCFNCKKLFEALKEIKPANNQKEYYLTDTIEILISKGCKTGVFKMENQVEAVGVNTIDELKELENTINFSNGGHH